MSTSESTQLVSNFFMVSVNDLFASPKRNDIEVDINPDNRDIISLVIAGLRITTDRDNWAKIFNEFARVCTAEVLDNAHLKLVEK